MTRTRRAPRRGLFLVLEGLDGAGTTTQGQRLASALRSLGRRAHFTAEPSSGPIGTEIRHVLAGRIVARGGGAIDRRELALLFAADRLDHLQSDVEPKLAAGIDVICDRYVLSSLAYQALDAPRAWVEELNRFAPPPDVTLFLRVRPEVALQRRQADSHGAADLFETLPLQRRVARNYAAEVRRLRRAHRIVVLDGERGIGDVAAAIAAAVAPLLRR